MNKKNLKAVAVLGLVTIGLAGVTFANAYEADLEVIEVEEIVLETETDYEVEIDIELDEDLEEVADEEEAEIEIEIFSNNACLAAPVIMDQSRLGTITHYNGLIFGNFYAEQADVEGALAVGGVSTIGTRGWGFDFGAADPVNAAQVIGSYTNPNNYPTFLSRNMPTFSGGESNVYNGDMVVGLAIQEQFCNATTLNAPNHLQQNNANIWLRRGFAFASPEAIDGFFSSARNQSVNLSNTLAGATHQSDAANITVRQLNTNSGVFTDMAVFTPNNLQIAGQTLRVINIIDAGHVVINEPKITAAFSSYDLVVLNFPNATSIDIRPAALFVGSSMMGSHNPNMGAFAQTLLWNFPIANSITVEAHDVIGSVLAPNAHYHANGGSTNGMLIAAEYTTRGGHELHAFRPVLRDRIFDVTPITPEVDPGGEDEDLNDDYLDITPLPEEVDLGNWSVDEEDEDLEDDEDLDIDEEKEEDDEDLDIDEEKENDDEDLDIDEEKEEDDEDLDIDEEEEDKDLIGFVPLPDEIEMIDPEIEEDEEYEIAVALPDVVTPEVTNPENEVNNNVPVVSLPGEVTTDDASSEEVMQEDAKTSNTQPSISAPSVRNQRLPQTGTATVATTLIGVSVLGLAGVLVKVKKSNK